MFSALSTTGFRPMSHPKLTGLSMKAIPGLGSISSKNRLGLGLSFWETYRPASTGTTGRPINTFSLTTVKCRELTGKVPDQRYRPMLLCQDNYRQLSQRNFHLLVQPQARFSSSSASSQCDEIYAEVADLIKNKTTNILVMVGAGISTPSGIPDFRSPGTGLYENLQKYDLPYPEAIFDIHYFMMNPLPFYTLAQDLYPGFNYKPNIVHYFLKLLHEKEKLQKVYTQNIDGLERMAGIPEEKLMEAHGSFATASCTICNKAHSSEMVKNAILKKEIPKCESKKCKGKVKPDIVFFGEALPKHFWDYDLECPFSDLLIVIGTSLEVYPFAGIADTVGYKTPRLLINREHVGSFGTREKDYMLLGDLEKTVQRLANAMEWGSSLNDLCKSS